MAKKSSKSSTKVRVRSGGRKKQLNSPLPSLKFIVPVCVLVLLVGAITFMSLFGYETATGSAFFSIKNVDIRGVERTSRDDIQRVVAASTEKAGVWNADIADLKMKIEKFPFVKSASVSRSLPNGIRVNIEERIPAAIVKLSSGNYLVDTEGTLLVPVKGQDKDFPIVLQGWDESKTEKAGPDNIARLKVYKRMLDEARQFDVAARVKEIGLSNPRQPVAFVEDSGRTISISLARDNLGKSLRTAVDALNGKGGKIKSIDSAGVHPIIQYLEFEMK